MEYTPSSPKKKTENLILDYSQFKFFITLSNHVLMLDLMCLTVSNPNKPIHH